MFNCFIFINSGRLSSVYNDCIICQLSREIKDIRLVRLIVKGYHSTTVAKTTISVCGTRGSLNILYNKLLFTLWAQSDCAKYTSNPFGRFDMLIITNQNNAFDVEPMSMKCRI